MPDPFAQLTADLAELRTGRGPRREELRRRLNQVDARLRDARNRERLRLAQLHFMARTGQRPTSALEDAIAQSAQRLAELDTQIVQAVAAMESETEPHPTVAPTPPRQDPNGAEVEAARAALRGRLWLASSLLGGLPLPAAPVRRLQMAIGTVIRRLGS